MAAVLYLADDEIERENAREWESLEIVLPSDKSVRFTSFYLKQKAAVICKEQITNSKYQNMYKCI